jgi:DNA-binding CsgD family transcriptional regulator
MTLMSDLLGWSLVAQGDSEQATVVLGAASAMWGSIGQQLYGSDHWNSLRASAVEQARADLGTAGFQRWWAMGESMSVAELLDYVFDDGSAGTDPARRLAGQDWDSLSPREREVAELVVEGLTNKEVAARLVLSTRTVEGHVERILHKLNIGRRAQIATVLRGGADETTPRTRW